MNYDVQKLMTKDECTRLIEAVNQDKGDFISRKILLSKRLNGSPDGKAKIGDQIIQLEAQMEGFKLAIPKLEDGVTKSLLQNDILDATSKLFRLNLRLANFGIIEQLQTALEYNGTDKSIVEADLLIAAVTSRQASNVPSPFPRNTERLL